MPFLFTQYFTILFVTALLSAGLSVAAYRQRRSPGGKAFTWMMLSVTLWALVSSLETGSVGQPLKIFWSKWEYVGANGSAVFFLLFAIAYTGHGVWLHQKKIWLLALLPLFNIALAATNDWHGLVWTGFTPSPIGQNLLIYNHGPGYYWVTSTIYGQLASATVLLALSAGRGSTLQRKQTRSLVIAALIPWVGSIVYTTELSPFPGLNLVPTTLLFTGLILLLTLTRYQLLDLVPVARDLLLEKMWDGMMVLDTQHRIVDINPAGRAFLDLIDKKVTGTVIDKVWPEAAQKVYEEAEHVAGISELAHGDRFFEIRVSPLNDNQAHIHGRLLIWHDITRRKQAESERESLIAQLEEANATKDRFFSIVSHDLKNPFNTIVSFSRLMLGSIETLSREEIVELTQELSKSAERTRSLLDNLLEWSRSQRGLIQVEARPLYLAHTLATVTDWLTGQAADKSITIETDVTADAVAWADAHLTETALCNLISNAIKFSHAGGVVKVQGGMKDGQAWITVSDQGVGIPPERLDKLFRIESVKSTPGTAKEQGSGLGLVLCKEFMEKQGGQITAQSTPGQGSAFTIVLPRAPEA